MNPFRDKIAIVTGGASGMGRCLCRRLGAAGAVVVAADINGPGAEEAAEEVSRKGGRARAVALDTTDAPALRRLVAETADEHGRLDYMFNNAGILIAGEVRDMDDALWERILEVNLKGVLTGARAAYDIMARQGFGHIINTASVAGLVAVPAIAAYSTTKHAVVGFSRALRAEAAGLGVRVSVACPGLVDTSIFGTGIMLNADMGSVLGTVPIRPITADRAAGFILRGVEKNREIIVFPAHARLLWLLYRFFPGLFARPLQKAVADFRGLKRRPGSPL